MEDIPLGLSSCNGGFQNIYLLFFNEIDTLISFSNGIKGKRPH
jgi:hypothetical protein